MTYYNHDDSISKWIKYGRFGFSVEIFLHSFAANLKRDSLFFCKRSWHNFFQNS